MRVFKMSRSSDSDDAVAFQPETPLMTPRNARNTAKCAPLYQIICFIATGVFMITLLCTSVSYLYSVYHIQISDLSEVKPFIVGCHNISQEIIWTHGIPKLLTESAYRLVDINLDGINDIIFGFATGADGYATRDYYCDIYFNGSHPCFGGVMALDGASGHELWRHYTDHEIFALNCGADLNLDGVFDCLAAGRVAMFHAVSGKTGEVIWSFTHPQNVQDMNFYTAQLIPDQDGDGIPDIINTHGGDPFGEPGSKTRLSGKIFVISGATGQVLQWVTVPDGRECYFSPVLYTTRTGGFALLFGTGGETHGGSLWFITLTDLYKGDILKAKALYTDEHKGIMTPPVLIDLTQDGFLDIMFNTFNSSSILIDGVTHELIWNFTFPGSETYATPAAGFYNNDSTPDFMVHWQYGPGFPIYYHSVTTILDGRTGMPILKPYIRDSIGVQTSPLVVSMEGHGNDLFLFFTNDCLQHEGQGGEYKFVKGTNVHEKSRSDVCRLRFKTEAVSKLYALNSHIQPPGIAIYNSVNNLELERAFWVNSTQELLHFLETHPYHRKQYTLWKEIFNTRKQQHSRRKRHVGPHDEKGLQRLISTGTLAPSLLGVSDPDFNHSIDFVFATYWFYPAKTSVILPRDQKCIDDKMAEQTIRFDPQSKYYGMDDDGYEHSITHECLEASHSHGTETQDTHDPYLIHMGQMTVYRMRIKCTCEGNPRMSEPGATCARTLPYSQQQWPGYMGARANSHWYPRGETHARV